MDDGLLSKLKTNGSIFIGASLFIGVAIVIIAYSTGATTSWIPGVAAFAAIVLVALYLIKTRKSRITGGRERRRSVYSPITGERERRRSVYSPAVKGEMSSLSQKLFGYIPEDEDLEYEAHGSSDSARETTYA